MISTIPHVVFVQYGDYREAFERLSGGGSENYAAQRYSVEFVGNLAKSMRVTVIALPPERHDVMLSNGVRAIAMGWADGQNTMDLLRTLHQLNPSHLILNTPFIPALLWGLFRVDRVLPNFADSFLSTSIRGVIKQKLLATILNFSKFDFVANHNFPAALNLVKIGVKSEKVLAWDWPSHVMPSMYEIKKRPNSSTDFSIFYVGSVLASKGVGDLISAVAILRKRNISIRLAVAGTGAIDEMKQLADELGISEHVDFKGRVANTDVIELMRAHDAVVVPSRRTYPEGLPMAIYEGLCSRTPLIVSSHPMFTPALKGQDGVLMFEEGSPESLSESIYSLIQSESLYQRVSSCSAATWESIQVPLKTGELLTRWISGTQDSIAALKNHSMKEIRRKFR